MAKINAINEVLLDGYTSQMDLDRGLKIELDTGEFSSLVYKQDAIIEKYELNKSDYPLTEQPS